MYDNNKLCVIFSCSLIKTGKYKINTFEIIDYVFQRGFKILFEHFKLAHNPNHVIMSLNRRFFNGSELNQCGFMILETLPPNQFIEKK